MPHLNQSSTGKKTPKTNELRKQVTIEPTMSAPPTQQPSPNAEHQDTPTAPEQNPSMASHNPHPKVKFFGPPSGEDKTQPQPTPNTSLQEDVIKRNKVQAVPNNEQTASNLDQIHMVKLHTDQPSPAPNTNEATAHAFPTLTTSIYSPLSEPPSETSSVYATPRFSLQRRHRGSRH